MVQKNGLICLNLQFVAIQIKLLFCCEVFVCFVIDIDMDYLVVNKDCVLCLEKPTKLKANVPYQLTDLQDEYVLCLCQNQICAYTNFYALFAGAVTKTDVLVDKNCDGVENVYQKSLVQIGANKYLFMFFSYKNEQDFRCFEFAGKQVFVLLGKNLIVDFAGAQLVNKNVGEIVFSHYEIENDFCCIFFEGQRQFVVVLNKNDLVWADFYDEYNVADGEKQILKHLCDGLNHGRVLNIKDNKSETYLVYLDDNELHLKPKFVALIFMDCLLAKNYKYCSTLVCENLKFDQDGLKQFFPEFDAYFPLNANSVVLFKKNALVGICDFEIVDDKIANIIVS